MWERLFRGLEKNKGHSADGVTLFNIRLTLKRHVALEVYASSHSVWNQPGLSTRS
jgi:hypothetical protein